MPDHLHLLLTAASPAGELQRFVALAKQRTGFVFARIAGERLWQASFFERTLRETDEDLVVVEYILNNPVRARLVNAPREYPHWGSQVFTREQLLEAIALRPRRP